jgi:hypothetical protein
VTHAGHAGHAGLKPLCVDISGYIPCTLLHYFKSGIE